MPASGSFYVDNKYIDPFGCYFKNIYLKESGDYEVNSRNDCPNEGCKVCGDYFLSLFELALENNKCNKVVLDFNLLDLVRQAVVNSLFEQRKTAAIVP